MTQEMLLSSSFHSTSNVHLIANESEIKAWFSGFSIVDTEPSLVSIISSYVVVKAELNQSLICKNFMGLKVYISHKTESIFVMV